MAYVDYEYYRKEYGGTMPEEDFPGAEKKAEAYIRYLTSLNGDIFSLENDMVKDAVCAAAEVHYADAKAMKAREANGWQGPVKSENNDGYSVTYISEQKEGQTAEQALRIKVYDAVYPYLLSAGWLSRRVRCAHDHECGYYGL